MRIFITGISGLLGLNMAVQLREEHEVAGNYYSHPVDLEGIEPLELDLTRPDSAADALKGFGPDLVIHTAGLTSVEACEDHPKPAHQLNVVVAQQVGEVATAVRAPMVHISTDHLFDGTKTWSTEDDRTAPLNVYAQTKLQAEEAVLRVSSQALIVRTNFFGWGTSIRTSFSDWILRALRAERELTMFSDVFFTPLLINDLIDCIMDLVNRGAHGVLNVAGSGRLSKYDFAVKLAQVFGESTAGIRETSVEEFPFKAPRPRDMSLSSTRSEILLGRRMPTVEEGLHRLAALERAGYRRVLEGAIRVRSPESGLVGVDG